MKPDILLRFSIASLQSHDVTTLSRRCANAILEAIDDKKAQLIGELKERGCGALRNSWRTLLSAGSKNIRSLCGLRKRGAVTQLSSMNSRSRCSCALDALVLMPPSAVPAGPASVRSRAARHGSRDAAAAGERGWRHSGSRRLPPSAPWQLRARTAGSRN